MIRRAGAVSMLLATVSGACMPDDQRTESLDMERARQEVASYPPGVAAQLDSGNVAYRGGDYQAALAHYRQATDLGPEVAAAWFGVYMVQHVLGNQPGADSALARVQELQPGATLVPPPGGAGGRSP